MKERVQQGIATSQERVADVHRTSQALSRATQLSSQLTRTEPSKFHKICVAWSFQRKWGDLVKLGVRVGKPPNLLIW
jgi:hypothetical protein